MGETGLPILLQERVGASLPLMGPRQPAFSRALSGENSPERWGEMPGAYSFPDGSRIPGSVLYFKVYKEK